MNQLVGFPRHLSQHVGGFVIARGRLDELVPIENARMQDRTVIQWDKDDIDELGMMKVDILGLGMLTAIRKAFDLMEHHYGGKSHWRHSQKIPRYTQCSGMRIPLESFRWKAVHSKVCCLALSRRSFMIW